MTEHEAIKELYERVMQRVFEMSADYLMKTPKKGFETEFAKEKELALVLEDMLKGYEQKI